MCKKLFLILSVCLVTSSFAVNYYSQITPFGYWDNINTWGGWAFPDANDNVYINLERSVIIDATSHDCFQLHLASWSGNSNLNYLTITNGGSLEVVDWSYLGVAAGDVAELTIEKGSTYTGVGPTNIGYNGHCDAYVYKGTLVAGGLYIPNPWATGSGVLHVYDGLVDVGNQAISELVMADVNGLIDIYSGQIRIWGLWHDVLLQGYIDTDKIIGYGGDGVVTLTHDGDFTVIYATNPLDPDPEDGASVSSGPYVLGWTLPDPYSGGGVVSCDVHLSDNYPEADMYYGDPNFLTYATKIVDDQVTESVAWTLVTDKEYYWRIDVYDTSSPEPQPVVGEVFHFSTGNQAPVVNAGVDEITWLESGSATVDLLGTVTDDGLPGPYTVLWTVESVPSGATANISPPSADQLDVSVTVDTVGDYTLKLTADDGEKTGDDILVISVYTDNCEASKASGITLLKGDINEDCDVNLADLAELAADWLKSTRLPL